ncbi:Cu(+)/Ag(+) sensor histidine kinase [Thiomonas sp. FB-Cd]|uniref:Cu(+)/Ag(+) sensor histidine kinase n=1 Tax=Thiomonas sp. FB-Cd TaxID=1158292 RepID=UPI0004DF1237|nr:Cu(+)/Ag(+) sensor histidine kinase [Thiomonas sp. FB-Cd]
MRRDDGMRRPTSLAVRVTLLVGLATTTMFLLAAWGIERSIERHFAQMDLVELQGAWQSVSAALKSMNRATNGASEQRRLADAVAGSHNVYVLVRDASGHRLYETTPPALSALTRGTPAAESLNLDTLVVWKTPQHTYRGAVLRSGRDTVVMATTIDFHLQYLLQLQEALWAGTLLASVVSVFIARLAVQQGHAPLRRISARMREMTTERLHVRLSPQQVPVELADLVIAFNAMLTRIEQSFLRLRDVSADIAHELRTPVTNLTTHTQVALSKARDVEAYREVLYSNLEEFERMGSMISDMLFLAQAEQGLTKQRTESVDLAVEVRALFDYFEAWAEERKVGLELEGGASAVDGDRAMLRRALSNLITNAIRYAPSGQAIVVSLSQNGQRVSVKVCNPGPDIAPEHLGHLFERFYRVDPSRQRRGEGAGLGLAIVKSIVEAHGGEVSVTSTHGTTCFVMHLRAAGPQT